MSKTNTKKYIATKEKIFRTVIEFLKTHEPEELSVSGICSLAKISRTTFYSHYQDTNILLGDLRRHYNHKALDFFRNHGLVETEDLSASALYCFLTYLKENKEYYFIFPKIAKTKEIREFNNELKRRILCNKKFPEGRNNMYYEYRARYCMSGFTSVIMTWMENGFVESIDEMSTILNECIDE